MKTIKLILSYIIAITLVSLSVWRDHPDKSFAFVFISTNLVILSIVAAVWLFSSAMED